MKYTLITLLFLAFIFSSCKQNSTEPNLPDYYRPVFFKTTDGGSSWEKMQNNTTPVSFSSYMNDIGFFDDSIGLAVGFNVIYRTNNSGDYWFKIDGIENADFSSLSIINLNTCFAVGKKVNGGCIVLKSDDKGIHWSIVNENNAQWAYDIDFSNQNMGYALYDNNYINKSSDGGLSWTWLDPISFGNYVNSDFINDNTGFAVGENYPYGIVSKTEDGGYSWTVILADSAISGALYNIKFYNENLGIAVGPNSAIKTTNGGLNWLKLSLPLQQNYYYGFRDIKFLSENKICICGSGFIFKSDDGGNSWNAVKLNSGYVSSISFINENTGFAAGSFDSNN
ncbi:MAG: hypothetical protein EHM58_13750 [Ignavibacteriae bacterium]|nr:MAG: hypothetical protein EHM58_13750 [Ignavibacteriota bacterium]